MASLPISSMDSRKAYLRSLETAKACLWLLSSRSSCRARTLGREQAVAMQESGRGLKRRCFAAAEDVVENEAQETVVGPTSPVQGGGFVPGDRSSTQRAGRCWPKMRRVTISSHVSFKSPSGGGASPWNCAVCGRSESGSSSSPSGS